jgi:tRNA-modifying protein YgfZ
MQSPSDLRERQRQAGAVFAAEGPAQVGEPSMPVHFGDPRVEYAAAERESAVFDWTDHALLELSGADRVTFLHNFCTNDIKGLSAGHGCEAFITNVKGRILGHTWIQVGHETIWLDAGPVAADQLLAHLERYIINEDVALADRSSEWGELLVMGPRAEAAILPIAGDAGRLGPLESVEVDCAPGPVRVSRRDVAAQVAYVVCARREALGELWRVLCDSGARPAGSAAWSALRIEAGLPVYGVDLSGENLAQEAGRTSSAISFTKGCYLGQEPIARIDAMGHVNRELRSLRIAGDTIPPAGARIFVGGADSAPVGTVTSAAFSFGTNSAVALALVRSSASTPGNQVFVEIGPSLSPATVFWSPIEQRT